jgi:T5SS/PEP-CTERM-associated repeat protein
LNVVERAEVLNRNVDIGRSDGSSGQVVIDGIGSRWECSGVPTIGSRGDGQLLITNGGEFETGNFGTTLARCPEGDGCVTVEGAGSRLSTRLVFVSLRGNALPNAQVVVRDGAQWSTSDVCIGENIDAWGMVHISDPGSVLEVQEQLICGVDGRGELAIENQTMVTCEDAFVSQSDPGNSAFATVDISGEGSCLWVNNSLSVNGDEAEGTVGGGGSVAVDKGGSLIVGNEIVMFPDGELELNSGLLIADSVRFNGGGEVAFNGGELAVVFYLDNMTNAGSILSPGHIQAGNTTIFGNYIQQSGATLGVDIGGIGVGSESDFVTVAGNAILDGQLQINLVNDFVPLAGQSFTVLGTGGDIFGFFDNAGDTQRVDTVGGEGSFLVRYGITSPNPDQIILSDYKPNPLIGDVNCDGVVDLLDVDPFINVLTFGPYQIKADINQDSEVNLLDVGPFVDLLL